VVVDHTMTGMDMWTNQGVKHVTTARVTCGTSVLMTWQVRHMAVASDRADKWTNEHLMNGSVEGIWYSAMWNPFIVSFVVCKNCFLSPPESNI
jgi:hypothetical protein